MLLVVLSGYRCYLGVRWFPCCFHSVFPSSLQSNYMKIEFSSFRHIRPVSSHTHLCIHLVFFSLCSPFPFPLSICPSSLPISFHDTYILPICPLLSQSWRRVSTRNIGLHILPPQMTHWVLPMFFFVLDSILCNLFCLRLSDYTDSRLEVSRFFSLAQNSFPTLASCPCNPCHSMKAGKRTVGPPYLCNTINEIRKLTWLNKSWMW